MPGRDDFRLELGERIAKTVERFRTKQDAAAAAGITTDQLNKWIAGAVKVPIEGLVGLAEGAPVDLIWLVGGDSPPATLQQGQSQIMAKPSSGGQIAAQIAAHLAFVPKFDIDASAGDGLVPMPEYASEHIVVEREWLLRLLPTWAGSNAAIGILRGSGDSMQPTIDDGDLIMVVNDPPDWAIERGGIFIVLHHDHLRIKRLQVIARTGDIRLISDNPRYDPEVVERDRIEFDLKILAQVFFTGGRPR